MALTPDDVERIALLARVEVSAAEVEQVLGQLTAIFGLIEQMQAVDTDGVEPMSHAQDLVLRLRPDAASEPDLRALYQGAAPAVEDGLYLVPKVME
jgi:aspartyl-tRNA(Asn)/glutamyl-tRNA(Gln) amidotransferase subunit C